MCAGAYALLSSRLSVNSSNHTGRSRKRSSESRLPTLFVIVFGLWGVIRSSVLGPVRHFALGLDLLKTNPAMSKLMTNSYQNWRTGRAQEEVRNCPFLQKNCLHLFDQPWFLTADPLVGISMVFEEVSKRYNSKRYFE